MKVVAESKNPVFPMRITCAQVVDENGYTYGKKIDFCGCELEIEESDVKKHRWSKYPDEHGTDYGVICPRCGQFTMIPEDMLPRCTKEAAEEIYLS